jgi:hypothetical protein
MMFNALAELVQTTQSLINNGWRFATKGNKVRYGYESESVDGFLESLCSEERSKCASH